MTVSKVVWLTGIPNSGKTTLGKELFNTLSRRGERVFLCDSDEFRKMYPNLGYTHKDRLTLFDKLGDFIKDKLNSFTIIIISATANLILYRDIVKRKILLKSDISFLEVFVDCPVEICATYRDKKKGIYSLAEKENWKLPIYIKKKFDFIRSFESCRKYIEFRFKHYSYYEPPIENFLHIRSDSVSLKNQVEKVIEFLGE